MMFKVLGIERAWQRIGDGLSKPRQLFVTQSRVLAEKVEEYFTKMAVSLASAAHTSNDLQALAARKKLRDNQGLVDKDEEVYQRGDLPQRYKELTDEHFPAFLSFDHVRRFSCFTSFRPLIIP